MTRIFRNLGLAALVCLAGPLTLALAQVSDAQNKLLARRAAEADCYRKLAEAVYGVQINSQTYVRDFVTESDEIRASVDAIVKGVRLGQPRYYEDGTCEVEGEVTVAKLITALKEVHAAHYKGNSVKTIDFEQIKQTLQKDVIRAVGAGAPRPDLPPGLPAGVEGLITALPSGYTPPAMTIPPLWQSIPAQARLMALEAARRDAQRKLLERIEGLRLTSNTLVRDFVTEYDEISTNAQGLVIGATEVRRYLHSDELIAEVTMEVPVEKVLTRIKELHSQYYRGNTVSTTDITNIKQNIQRDVFEATGCGVPREQFVQQAVSAGYEMPSWITTKISAEGEATDPEIDTAQGRLRARRAAEVVALRNLAEQINGLEVRSSTLVRDFVTEYDEIRTQMNSVIAGAVFSPPVYAAGTARVTATIAAAEVWTVVNSQLQIVKRGG